MLDDINELDNEDTVEETEKVEEVEQVNIPVKKTISKIKYNDQIKLLNRMSAKIQNQNEKIDLIFAMYTKIHKRFKDLDNHLNSRIDKCKNYCIELFDAINDIKEK